MRHGKRTCKLGRTTSHRTAMFANMLKSLIEHGRIETTVAKAKELKRHADKMITLAKKDTLASRRKLVSTLRIQHNSLTPKEAKQVKAGKTTLFNRDRSILKKLYGELSPKFAERQGGYTRLVRLTRRAGDDAPTCIVEYV